MNIEMIHALLFAFSRKDFIEDEGKIVRWFHSHV